MKNNCVHTELTEKPDGGPAFAAISISDYNGHCVQEGMSLRDWFAGRAITGLLFGLNDDPFAAADKAYLVADAMIKARS